MKNLRVLLLPLSLLYWWVTAIRNWLFERGVLRTTNIGVPVISVGNISSGGTGKTPFVEVVVRKLQSKGRKPAILSRGYGRKSRGYVLVSDGHTELVTSVEAGDEPAELAGRLNNVAVVVDEDRVGGARRVVREQNVDCIVLDDGFQHRYIGRDIDIVLLTADEILEARHLLPAGDRRETMGSLRRADLIVVSKCSGAGQYHEAANRLARWKSARRAGFRMRSKGLQKVADRSYIHRNTAENAPVLLFSGIGSPKAFAASVLEFGCRIVGRIDFPDHHWYSGDDLTRIHREFKNREARFAVTTRKDLVRLQALGQEYRGFLKDIPLCVLESEPDFIAGEDALDELIEEAVR